MRLLNIVHVSDGSVSLGVLGEANKAETTAATGVAVLYDDLRLSVMVACERARDTYGFLDLTELLELATKSLVVRVPCEAAIVAC